MTAACSRRLLNSRFLCKTKNRPPAFITRDFGIFRNNYKKRLDLFSAANASAVTLSTRPRHSNKMSTEHIYPNDTTVIQFECEEAFNALTEKEKLYAHHMSKASWFGSLIVLFQTSHESPLIFSLLHKLFRYESIEELKVKAVDQCGFTEDDFNALLIYTTAVFSNKGNYKAYGDLKFIPNFAKELLPKLLALSKAMELQPNEVQSLMDRCITKMYTLDPKEVQLGFPEIGVTTYFSKNCTKQDSEIINKFLKKENIEPWNSRIFKTVDEVGKVRYEIRLASEEIEDEQLKQCFSDENGNQFVITRGDYSHIMKYVNSCLQDAKDHALNDTEAAMIENYVSSFKTGSIDAHKTGSKFWVKDKNPVIESYIGFIENYRDPAGMRGEFEGFVAMVNKSMSKKFAELVNRAEEFLPLLPWPSTYEIDKFLSPDFVSLDILTFAASDTPIGINIPNYEEIKQYDGFKNVSLGNVIQAALKSKDINYLSQSDQDLINEYGIASLELVVGLHELLGHGTGKLFKKEEDGSFNFDPEKVFDVETGKKISSWYNVGETYSSIFTSLSSAFEECRAETVAMYLSTVPEILKIFGHEGSQADDVLYTSWLIDIHAGVESLKTFNPETNSWLQAHSQAAFVALQVLLEKGEGFVTIEETTGKDGKPDLMIHVDRSKILSVGFPAIGNFLKKLQAYRSTADIAKAQAMFDKYSAVTAEGPYPFLNYRKIVLARRKPRKLFGQPNTFVKNGSVVLKNYESSPTGFIQSWLDRFENMDELDKAINDTWTKDSQHFV